MRRGQPAVPGPKWEEFEALIARARKALDAARYADGWVEAAKRDAADYQFKRPHREPEVAHFDAIETAKRALMFAMIEKASHRRSDRFIDAADELREVRRLLLAAACEALTDLTNFESNLRFRAGPQPEETT